VVPSVRITPDLQIVDPGLAASDTAVIAGLRMNVTF
jgi:carbohydrate-selective porin OprB